MSDALAAQSVAEVAARAAGDVIRAALDGPREVRHKGAVDLVTQVDLAAEEAIRAVLAERAPGVHIQGEETGGDAAEVRWVVDPLDGTTNFVHGFPAFGVSVALVDHGRPIAGCVYNPLSDAAAVAALGHGAWCGGAPLRVSGVSDLSGALALTGFGYDRRQRAAWYLHFVKGMLEQAQGLRRAGAAALDFVHIASGRADAYWEFELKPWDVAAGLLLVQEAGGRVTDIDGRAVDLDAPVIVASNGAVHEPLMRALRRLRESAP